MVPSGPLIFCNPFPWSGGWTYWLGSSEQNKAQVMVTGDLVIKGNVALFFCILMIICSRAGQLPCVSSPVRKPTWQRIGNSGQNLVSIFGRGSSCLTKLWMTVVLADTSMRGVNLVRDLQPEPPSHAASWLFPHRKCEINDRRFKMLTFGVICYAAMAS